MNPIHLVIFDMDGLMFDTGQLSYRAYLQTAKKYNFSMTHFVYYYLTGRRDSEIRKRMKDLYGKEQPVNLWRDDMLLNKKTFLLAEQRVHKKKGLLELIAFLKQQNVKIAIASSSRASQIDHYFEIEGMEKNFDYITSGEEVENGKPNPEIFLKTCQKANVKPENTIVLEDSVVGIQAAKIANMQAVQVPDDISYLPTYQGEFPILLDENEWKEINFNVPVFKDLLEVKEYLNQILQSKNI